MTDTTDITTTPATASRIRPSRVVAAAVVLILASGAVAALMLRDSDAPDAGAVAEEFIGFYVRGDLDTAATYLAADVDPGILSTEDNSDPLAVRFREATGHRVAVGSCEEAGPHPKGTLVECGYTYHDFRSDEIGRGPFGVGSVYGVVVEGGEVVAFEDQPAAFSFTDPEGFSMQMWTPFAAWVSRNHAEARDVMYSPDGRGWNISEESIPLWEQYLNEWAAEVNPES